MHTRRSLCPVSDWRVRDGRFARGLDRPELEWIRSCRRSAPLRTARTPAFMSATRRRRIGVWGVAYLRWLSDLLSDRLPLVLLVFFDRRKERSALFSCWSATRVREPEASPRFRFMSSVPHLQRTQHSAYPTPIVRNISVMSSTSLHTLYQCFFTLPSVRAGKLCDDSVSKTHLAPHGCHSPWQSHSS